MKVYRFRKYDNLYPVLYIFEKNRLNKVIPKSCLIEHIGSTAVPGLSGKGIIDIMICCPKSEISKVKSKLISKGYELGVSSDKGRLFLKRETKLGGKNRRFHVHITTFNHPLWNKAIKFRDYLIKNPIISREYEQLKKRAILKCNNDGEIYKSIKHKFIEKYTQKAMNKSKK